MTKSITFALLAAGSLLSGTAALAAQETKPATTTTQVTKKTTTPKVKTVHVKQTRKTTKR